MYIRRITLSSSEDHEKYVCGGISNVATVTEYRSQGLSRHLLRMVLENMRTSTGAHSCNKRLEDNTSLECQPRVAFHPQVFHQTMSSSWEKLTLINRVSTKLLDLRRYYSTIE